jgi:hypothetical protein
MILNRLHKKSKSEIKPVIACKMKTHELSGARKLPDCFLNPKEEEKNFNRTLRSVIHPVRFTINSKIKPKSKNSMVRLSKLKIPRKNKMLNSEVVSPSKQKDLFDVNFS